MGLLTYPKVGAHCATTNKIFSYQVKPQGGAIFFYEFLFVAKVGIIHRKK
jgi:hypothetical protein